jgi:aryl-alcohol dehydrogenase-like predicted oxidoreductase
MLICRDGHEYGMTMKYRMLGNTGMRVSEIGVGTNTIAGGGSHGDVDEADGAAALQRAFELGVTFYDTSPVYSDGRSEEVVGRVFGNNPDVVICSKVSVMSGPLTPAELRKAAESSLRRLRRDVIDVYLLQQPSTESLTDPGIKTGMEELLRDGLIRSYGASTLGGHHLEQVPVVLGMGGYSSIELEMNITEQEPADDLLPMAERQGVGIVVRVPLGSGLLTGKYESLDGFTSESDRRGAANSRGRMERRLATATPLRALAQEEGVSVVHAALAWVLSHPDVSVIIPGCKNVAQVEDNVEASNITLSSSFLERAAALRFA